MNLTLVVQNIAIIRKFKNDISFTIRPIDISKNGIVIEDTIFNVKKYAPTLYTFLDGKGKIKLIPIDYNIEINTRHPYKLEIMEV